jgi:hypothetical protein
MFGISYSAVVVAAVGKWESRGFGEISKRGGKVGFLDFSTARLFHSLTNVQIACHDGSFQSLTSVEGAVT